MAHTAEQKAQYMSEWRHSNKDAVNARKRKWRQDNPEAAREQDRASYRRNKVKKSERQREAKYGLTPERFTEMLAEQNNSCVICTASMADRRGNAVHVDHCHTTGAVRGILCSTCNTGLGKFKDDAALLRKAAAYLDTKRY